MSRAPTGAPPVVAVVVTRNPGPFLETTLESFAQQDYPSLSVLVVDAGSEKDPTARVAAALPSAFVRRTHGRPGFGGAANEALAAVDGAAFFLLCHDDVALDPDAVRIMVEEAYRSNAGIVGPKLVRADDPGVLLDVGRAIDRLGGSHTGIEPGELDQEQHDAVRDVFYVSSAAMLVRTDLFRELEGFDPDTFPGSEDLDFCWRARLAGARVMVAPDARGRHREAAAERPAADRPDLTEVARRRVRVVLTCYSVATLLWVVPLGVLLAALEAVVFLPTRRRRAAIAGFTAWWWNFFHLGAVRRARRHAQHGRTIHDADLRELQVGAGERFGAFLTQHAAEDRWQSVGERGRHLVESVAEWFRTPASYALLTVLALVLFGSRDLFASGVPSVGTLVPWPGIEDLLGELSSAWRHTGMGSAAFGPPALGLMAALSTVLFGGVGLAETLVVVGCIFVGAIGAYRVARAVAGGPAAASTAAMAYVFVPVSRNAIANGRLGPLVLFALLPFVLLLIVRAGRFTGVAGASRRPTLGLILVSALATMWYPPAAAAIVMVALVLVVSAPIAGDVRAAVRGLGAAIVGVVGAAVLLSPWTVTLADSRDDLAALGIGFRPQLDLAEVLRFESGASGAGFAPLALLVAAGLALFATRGVHLAWAVRASLLVVTGMALVWLPSQLAPESAVTAPEAGLAIAALGVALGAALAVGGATRMPSRRGTRTPGLARARIVSALAAVAVAAGSLGFLADTVSGRWRGPDGDWAHVLSFTEDARPGGQFRILWVGDPDVLPLDPVELDTEVSWSLTRNGAGDARELWRAPKDDADELIGRAIDLARAGDTTRLGRMLAPAGVRYLAVPLRSGPDGRRARRIPSVQAALASQLDLARLRSEPGLVVYENESWAPARAFIERDVPSGAVPSLASAAATDLSGARSLGGGSDAAGTVLLGEAFDDGWSASGDDGDLRHEAAFGWVNGWRQPAAGSVSLAHDGQGMRYLLLTVEALLWIAALGWWLRGRGRARAARVAAWRRRRLEQAPRRSDFAREGDPAGFDDLDGFWEEP